MDRKEIMAKARAARKAKKTIKVEEALLAEDTDLDVENIITADEAVELTTACENLLEQAFDTIDTQARQGCDAADLFLPPHVNKTLVSDLVSTLEKLGYLVSEIDEKEQLMCCVSKHLLVSWAHKITK